MRGLRVAPAQQLVLCLGQEDAAEQSWWSELPEQARAEVLRVLAKMIARGVVERGVDADACVGDGEAVLGG